MTATATASLAEVTEVPEKARRVDSRSGQLSRISRLSGHVVRQEPT
jgi:hypothetical protein